MQFHKISSKSSNSLSFEVSGQGLADAIQESVKTKTNIALVHDRDAWGNLIRVGYVLVSRDTNKSVSSVKWFGNNINVKKISSNQGMVNMGRLEVKFIHPKKGEKHFILLPETKGIMRIRSVFKISKSKGGVFAIMFDVKSKLNGKSYWKPIMRYDCSHDFIHKDILSEDGKMVLKKVKLPIQNKARAINYIASEILDDLKKSNIINAIPQAELDFHSIKKLMIKLLNSSKYKDEVKSSMVAFSEERKTM